MPISAKGLSHALLAYGLWGCFGLYFHLLAAVPAAEVLIHRILWSALFVFILLAVSRQLGAFRKALQTPSLVGLLFVSALLISLNWGLYIWAVSQARVVEASLGYYLTPLFNVLLGVLLLKERISRHQLVALILASCGVGYQIYSQGYVPWVALMLAGLFSIYGLIRKQVQVDALSGLLVETSLMLPFALAGLIWFECQGGHFSTQPLLLVGAGVFTAIPLLAFASAARLLPLSVLGFVTYLAPSLQFISAVTLLDEPLDHNTLISFILIWLALAIFSADLYRRLKHNPGS